MLVEKIRSKHGRKFGLNRIILYINNVSLLCTHQYCLKSEHFDILFYYPIQINIIQQHSNSASPLFSVSCGILMDSSITHPLYSHEKETKIACIIKLFFFEFHSTLFRITSKIINISRAADLNRFWFSFTTTAGGQRKNNLWKKTKAYFCSSPRRGHSIRPEIRSEDYFILCGLTVLLFDWRD